MTTAYEIPLTPEPQAFSVQLAGTTYQMVVKWNPYASAWMFDLMTEDFTPLLMGMAIVTGADLLEQFGYLGVGGRFIAQTDHDPDAVPTFSNLGVTGHLYFLVD